ncbi:MAG: soluble lytic murein transglycosylase [Gaiellaceae bacterium]|nr:soluble lytic murein transglycosylase [Gaiellaceae bacterium]
MRRRRVSAIMAALLLGAVIAVVALMPQVKQGIQELTLPLQHEDIIRQQARDKNLDAALLAAMIYQESKFSDRTSSAGAKGLMQNLPSTAQFIAHKSGGTAFELRDLGTPQINIAYGSWYLRYLINRYDGNETLAVAAYNAGEHNVDIWVSRAGGDKSFDPSADIPFPETRGYVASVIEHRKLYRKKYPRELGLN